MIAFKELLLRAKRGEEKAFEELFAIFEPLVRKCSIVNGHVDEDLRQILLMEFVQAVRKFRIYIKEGRCQCISLPLFTNTQLKINRFLFESTKFDP